MEALNPEIIQLIKEAIRLEVKGRNFFLHAAEVTGNSLGKKMFEKLARDEVEHMKVFGGIFTEVTGGSEWKKYVRTEEEGEAGIIEGLKKRIKNAEREKGSSELEAIRIGMELERKAIDFFSKLAAGAVSAETRKIAQEISEQEQGHYDLLQAQYDSVHTSGFWFDVAEFKLDGQY